MIYIDLNIPMCLVGASHRCRSREIEILPALLHAGDALVTSVETFQEIVHRYRAIRSLESLGLAYEALETRLTTEPIELQKGDVDTARSVGHEFPKMSSRDCLHVAVMQRLGCRKVWSFDAGFDLVPTIERIE